MKLLSNKLTFLVVLLCGVLTMSAQNVPKAKGFVTDQAGIFTPEEKDRLEQQLQSFADTTSNEIAIVTVADLEGYDIFDYSLAFARENGVGSAKKNNGIVIAIKPKNEFGKGRVQIQVGKGLEGAIPDAICKRITELELIPRFKQGNYYAGVKAGLDVLQKFASGEYNEKSYKQKTKDPLSTGGSILFFIILIIVLFVFRGNQSYSRRNNLGFWAAMGLFSSMGSSHRGSWDRFSGGGGGGGFGGFGGGGFGGGGSGGSW
ncbi:MAG TPA: TPM domain-containing protein [Luteibaculaceae bacterium]|nr:TPM domain-containing protein [Luteibaculaceae bacterium]